MTAVWTAAGLCSGGLDLSTPGGLGPHTPVTLGEGGRERGRLGGGGGGGSGLTSPVVSVEGKCIGSIPQQDISTAELPQRHRQMQRSASSRVHLLPLTLQNTHPPLLALLALREETAHVPLRLLEPPLAPRLSPPRPASGAASVPSPPERWAPFYWTVFSPASYSYVRSTHTTHSVLRTRKTLSE